ncbi:inactive selenide, water dikinase-like protein [Halyomorpha halys]|uniref:inactive selenide, water dikinase-like protein n=1 Tax=Halyomorpha halys TaxID=286706 RepID=UPI000D0C7E38|nr:selenide, water dikinase-like [Halyomorpha halys]KAE8573734.1 Putative Selenide, water dikinase [Halyomorpha halys]
MGLKSQEKSEAQELAKEETRDKESESELPTIHKIGVGLDSSIIPIRNNLALVQTTDFFYPLIDDPFVMGQIACANVLSDLYAIGVSYCDNMMMILGVPDNMDEKERDDLIPLIVEGFKYKAKEAGSKVSGGDTRISACCIIGGTATSVCEISEIIMPDNAIVGDTIVLTKPLGTQAATMINSWLENENKWKNISSVISKEEAKWAFQRAVKSMVQLNKIAANLMHKFKAHAATDVTGFGLLGHAKNLARHQKNLVQFKIHSLPIISKMLDVDRLLGNQFHLEDGKNIETSGGLLICLPPQNAAAYCEELKKLLNCNAWVVGTVVEGKRMALISDNPTIIDVID